MRSTGEPIGYDARRSGIRLNVDCSDRALDRLEARLERIDHETGRPTALIGHSRGAHFAKALAHRRPELVSQAISLGAGLDTPFDISVPTKVAVAAVGAVHRRTTDRATRNGCLTDTCGCRFALDYAAPFPESVPLTSIYSRDGVVCGRRASSPTRAASRSPAATWGLAFNRKAYRAIAETLASTRTPVEGAEATAPVPTRNALWRRLHCHRLRHLLGLVGDQRAVAGRVDDALLEPLVTAVEDPMALRTMCG